MHYLTSLSEAILLIGFGALLISVSFVSRWAAALTERKPDSKLSGQPVIRPAHSGATQSREPVALKVAR